MKQKKLLLLVVLIASIILILTNFYTIKVLSAVRAYINGESEFSKGQKDASIFLVTYLQTGNKEYMYGFSKAISIPIGDNIARTSLTNNDKDALTTQGFLMGRNHTDDIPDMIWLFKTFHNISFMQQAIEIWAATEPLINRLDSFGRSIYSLKDAEKLSDAARLQSIREISDISTRLSEKESAFSQKLDKVARDIKMFLQWLNIFLILVILGVTSLFAMRMLNSLSASERALKTTIIELNDTNRELEHFTHIASHDLKEPLRMVTGFLTQLQAKYKDQLDDKAHTYIHYAVDGATRMKRLIDELLEYSKTGISQVGYKKVDLNELMEEVKANFQGVLNETGAGIVVGALPQIKVNRTQMLQLFQNLLGNAIKYRSEAAPEIYVNAASNNTHWVFSVQDNGRGIEPEYFKKIFIIFQRLETDKKLDGTGIGLAICKKIAENHGGEIWVTSKPGKGSTFFFTISNQL
ncbi:ATP-binding protein [Ferruginibacter paludis]|uniref:sensor histidine kinase n=1 Tax=Ferruginibacter paludis TaxID=1310417 RepID=UPI0025B570BC|nr:ATP-binding protein [Ferruginibacter paludis]MDN3657049.1 ATP-binding protein [Ferruginibacter paludis]